MSRSFSRDTCIGGLFSLRPGTTASILFILLFCVSCTAGGIRAAPLSSADDSPRDLYWWCNFGMGVGSKGLAGNISGNVRLGHLFLTAHASVDTELSSTSIKDYGLLAGYALGESDFHCSLTAGLATVRTTKGGLFGPVRESPSIIGFPFEAQFFYRPGRSFGIGLCGFVVLNRYDTMLGCTVSIQGGYLR